MLSRGCVRCQQGGSVGNAGIQDVRFFIIFFIAIVIIIMMVIIYYYVIMMRVDFYI